MTNLITIQQAVDGFKELIETSIIEGGIKAKEAMIRSSRPINFIHEAVKADFIRKGISPDRIHPPLGASKPELKLAGFIKQKHQDVCVSPEGYIPDSEIMTEGILREATDYYGKDYTERTISVNIRSQMSSLAKNFDTLYERTIAEAQNLHVRCPKMVLGEVYMIPVKEYDAAVMDNNVVQFIDKVGAVEKYIKSFQAINGRLDYTREDYKYERVCLLLVDFEQSPAKIYSTNQDLINDGLLDESSTASIDELSWETFTNNILSNYETRFGS
ncbi:MAG: restriction endonuclease [Flavobacteriales bacterium]|nr:restriction endonuclease [Flavobacteriales bacterium]